MKFQKRLAAKSTSGTGMKTNSARIGLVTMKYTETPIKITPISIIHSVSSFINSVITEVSSVRRFIRSPVVLLEMEDIDSSCILL